MSNEVNANDPEMGELISQCRECLTGMMRLKYITYFTYLDTELVTVPNFPAWICDVCGRREFDPRAVTWLNTLLNPAAGRSRANRLRRKNRLPGGDQPQP